MDSLLYFMPYIGFIIRVGVLLIGLPIIHYISHYISAAFAKHFSKNIGVLFGHIFFYGSIAFIGVNLLYECGFNISALLGAAGIVGIAVGFASQASISNIISGFFLLLERPFTIGDIIKCGDTTGIAESIDLLAVRVRTLDNRLVRIPNEIVLKSSLINLTYYPVKRIDLLLSTTYMLDCDVFSSRVISVIGLDQMFLVHPIPSITLNKVGQLDYDTEMRSFFSVRVWVAKEQFTYASSMLILQLKREFDTDNNRVTIVQLN